MIQNDFITDDPYEDDPVEINDEEILEILDLLDEDTDE